jgi:hypothetical protein
MRTPGRAAPFATRSQCLDRALFSPLPTRAELPVSPVGALPGPGPRFQGAPTSASRRTGPRGGRPSVRATGRSAIAGARGCSRERSVHIRLSQTRRARSSGQSTFSTELNVAVLVHPVSLQRCHVRSEFARGFGNLIGNLIHYPSIRKHLRNAFHIAKSVRLPRFPKCPPRRSHRRRNVGRRLPNHHAAPGNLQVTLRGAGLQRHGQIEGCQPAPPPLAPFDSSRTENPPGGSPKSGRPYPQAKTKRDIGGTRRTPKNVPRRPVRRKSPPMTFVPEVSP